MNDKLNQLTNNFFKSGKGKPFSGTTKVYESKDT